ncbi:Uncharacterised protein [Bordetella pertussis]|nr:Uncharacterised protein [Bordetella pertussis]
MKSPTTAWTACQRDAGRPCASRKSSLSMDCEISTTSRMSRMGSTCVSGGSTHCGRASASSSHTATFSHNWARPRCTPGRVGDLPVSVAMASKKGRRNACRPCT